MASRHRFPRSAQEPALGSRRLCAGHHPGRKQDVPRAPPRPLIGAWFRWHPLVFDTLPTVHFRSSSQHIPDGFIPPFPRTLTTPAIVPEQLPAAWALTLPSEPEGPSLISCAAGTLVRSADLPSRRRGARSAARAAVPVTGADLVSRARCSAARSILEQTDACDN
jgi:hypothetical protein